MSPDPDFLWLGEKHKEALATLEYGILESKGFLLLTGEAGAGKTLLINALIKSTHVQAIIATIPDPDLEILDFFHFLSEEFQMNKKFETKGAFLIEFKRFLYEVYQSQGKVLLIVDEAQRLNHDLLEQIRILSNIECDYRKLINIFLVGQTELNQILREERNVAFRKRIAVSHHLDALDQKETEKYIIHRMDVAGSKEEIFDAKAIREIFSFSMGCPRLINIICDHALIIGYSKGLQQIDDSVIAECRKDLHILSEPNKRIEEDKDLEDKEAVYKFNAPAASRHKSKRNWVYPYIALALIGIGLTLYNFMSEDTPPVAIKESQQTRENSTSEKESRIAKNVNAGDIDKGSLAHNPQTEDTTKQAKLNETAEKAVVAAVQGDRRTQNVESSENNFSDSEQKTIIQFEHDSMKLPDEAYGALDRIVKLSSSAPESEIIVEGYTDSFGEDIYNQNLSKSRADVIKKYLVNVGIPATKIKTIGMGSKNPIADNHTFEGRKQNRRIEIRVKLK